jgi:hypothetical protein
MGEIKFYIELFYRWLRENFLSLTGNYRGFYCRNEIEGKRKCRIQCEHCKEYYKPLEK